MLPPRAASRVEALRERTTHLKALRGRLRKDLTSKEAEVVELSATIERLCRVEVLFRALMDLLVHKQVQSVEAITTEGLQTIFYDQDLHLESELSTKYNQVSIDFLFRQGSKDDPRMVRAKPLENFGGGPASVVSLILKVLTIQRMKRLPLLVLDESLDAVAEEYIEGTSQFLSKLASRLGLNLLLVTHKTSFADHADHAAQCREVIQDDDRFLALKRIR